MRPLIRQEHSRTESNSVHSICKQSRRTKGETPCERFTIRTTALFD